MAFEEGSASGTIGTIGTKAAADVTQRGMLRITSAAMRTTAQSQERHAKAKMFSI